MREATGDSTSDRKYNGRHFSQWYCTALKVLVSDQVQHFVPMKSPYIDLYLPFPVSSTAFTAKARSFVSVWRLHTQWIFMPCLFPVLPVTGAPLILFYLRAPLNINVAFSLNYSLTGLPTLSTFVYQCLFLSFLAVCLPSLLLAQSLHPEG